MATEQLPTVYNDGDIMVVRASGLGSCVRALSAYGRYEEVIPLQRKEMLGRTAQEGNLHESTVIDHLRNEGYDVTDSQGIVGLSVIKDRVEVRGHVDGIVGDTHVVEVKTMSKSRFDDYQRHGLDGFPKYQWQLSAYMYAVGDMLGHDVKAIYAVKRRDDGLIDVKEIDTPPIDFIAIKKKLLQVWQHRRNKTLPGCDITGNEQFWCPFPFLHDEDVKDMELPEETNEAILELVLQYEELRGAEVLGKAAGEKKREVGKDILKLMDDRDVAHAGDFKITRVRQVQNRVDLDLLRADMKPDQVAKYEKVNPIEYAKVTKRKKK